MSEELRAVVLSIAVAALAAAAWFPRLLGPGGAAAVLPFAVDAIDAID